MPDTVSVVIPTYNYGRFIGEAVESVLAQTLLPVEVIVVDDGSTDETEGVVGSFAERGVRYVRQENAGVCAARNRGVAESSGELIAFLDADDIWEPTKLERQVAKFVEDPEVGLVHCGMREFDSQTSETITLHLDGGEDGVAENLLLWDGPVVVGPGGTIVVRRKAFEDVGGFDPRMKVGEDWDFCYRVARKYKVGFVAEPLVNYRSHGAAAHHNVDNMERGMAIFYEKAFDTEDADVLALKDRALGNYHKVMSGSYFQAGRFGKFASHAVRSIVHRPANIGYFLSYPLRRLK
ncbi:MAG TPA: glycosyltransferase family A protein [Pyrinomonadaceae bacterium]|nr:glycosyltransferase family A protein [Pyrinomonadaceae bacterium]